MRHFNPRRPGAGRPAAGLLAGLLLALPGLAQTAAPAWNLATSGNPSQASTGHTFVTATAVDARGNVFLTGSFTNTIAFGSIQLTSAGNTDLFLAKWDATTQAFTWATRGGGTGFDAGNGLAVSGTSVYVTGSFASAAATTLAGQALPGAGGTDVFVAKYVDTSTGNTPATSSFAPGWVATGGGPGNDAGYGVAVSGPGVYVTGDFTGVANTSVAGQALTGAGGVDVFVAKYLDTSTGATPATSSFANGWATSGGGISTDHGAAIAVSGTRVYVTGSFFGSNGVRFAGQALTAAGSNSRDVFVARYTDTSTGATPATSSYADGWATSGGGLGDDDGRGLAVRGPGVFVVGTFATSSNAYFAGQALPGAGNTDMFVAKYLDTGTGSTPATSSYANGWATSGGGSGTEYGNGIAVSGTSVFVTGGFESNRSASFAGQALAGVGGVDVFVAKYLDTSTGSTPATSSFANGWATSGGGPGADDGYGLAISGQQVYVGGLVGAPATFGSLTFGAASGYSDGFLGRLPDASLLATSAAAPASAGLSLSPNPAAYGAATLRGAPFGALVQVLDAVGRVAATTTADASGRATLGGLAPGLYLVRAGTEVLRLAME